MEKINLSEESITKIDSKLKELLELCQIYKVPMFASVAVKNDETGTEYKNITYGTSSNFIQLTDDQIKRHILVANGFCTVPQRDSNILDYEEE